MEQIENGKHAIKMKCTIQCVFSDSKCHIQVKADLHFQPFSILNLDC